MEQKKSDGYPQPTPTFPDPPPAHLLTPKHDAPTSSNQELLQSHHKPLSQKAPIAKQVYTPTEVPSKQPTAKPTVVGSVKPVMGSSLSVTAKEQRSIADQKAHQLHSEVPAKAEVPAQRELSLGVAFRKPPTALASSVVYDAVPLVQQPQIQVPPAQPSIKYTSVKPTSQNQVVLPPSREPSESAERKSVGQPIIRPVITPPSREPSQVPERTPSARAPTERQSSKRSAPSLVLPTQQIREQPNPSEYQETPRLNEELPSEAIEQPPRRIEFKCQRGDLHQDEVLNIVCTELMCAGELCCNVCVEEFHQNHKVKPLKWIVSMTEKTLSSASIDTSRSRQQILTSESRDRVSEASDRVKQTLAVTLQTTQKLMKKLDHKLNSYGGHIPETQEQRIHPQTEQQMREYAYESLCRYQMVNRPVEPGQLDNRKKELSIVERQITSVLEGFEKYIKAYEFESRLKNILLRDTFEQYFGELRHSDMVAVSPSIIKFTGEERDFKIAVLEPQLKPGKWAYKFRLVDTDWACFGVCRLNTVQDVEYVWKYDKTGHGVYGMSASGKIYSHIHVTENYTDKGFKFDGSQTIVMRVDTTSRSIKFTTDSLLSHKKATVSYQQQDPNEPLYVCAILSKVGAGVEYRGCS